MARRRSQTLTEVELEFMQVLWSLFEANSVMIQKALRERGRELTDGSIRKVLTILERKHYVERRRLGRSFYYKPKIEPAVAKHSAVRDLCNRVFRGSVTNLIAALLDAGDVCPADVEEIKKLIAKREKGGAVVVEVLSAVSVAVACVAPPPRRRSSVSCRCCQVGRALTWHEPSRMLPDAVPLCFGSGVGLFGRTRPNDVIANWQLAIGNCQFDVCKQRDKSCLSI